MLKLLGMLVAAYTLWALFDGRVYAASGKAPGARMITRDKEARQYWAVIGLYGGMSIALLTSS